MWEGGEWDEKAWCMPNPNPLQATDIPLTLVFLE